MIVCVQGPGVYVEDIAEESGIEISKEEMFCKVFLAHVGTI